MREGSEEVSLAEPAKVVGRSFLIEICKAAWKIEAGLGHDEVRLYHIWHRSIRLADDTHLCG